MEGFTIIDGVVALVIVVSALLAYSRGFVREALAIAGWIVAAILAFIFAPQVQPLMKEIPYVGEKLLADSCELSMIAGFAGVFAVALVVASLFTPWGFRDEPRFYGKVLEPVLRHTSSGRALGPASLEPKSITAPPPKVQAPIDAPPPRRPAPPRPRRTPEPRRATVSHPRKPWCWWPKPSTP